MPQTSYIVIFLVIGFVVFITIKGELLTYRQAIFSSSDPTGSNAGNQNSSSNNPIGTSGAAGGSGIGSPLDGHSSTFAG